MASNSVDQPKVYAYAWIGKKRPAGGWPAGRYVGEAKIRDGRGELTDRRRIEIELK